jgi:hypothetical protein
MIELDAPPQQKFALLARAYALSGEKVKAQDIVNGLLEQAKEKYISPFAFACVYASLGQKDKALE